MSVARRMVNMVYRLLSMMIPDGSITSFFATKAIFQNERDTQHDEEHHQTVGFIALYGPATCSGPLGQMGG